jgi:hypothetical protein
VDIEDRSHVRQHQPWLFVQRDDVEFAKRNSPPGAVSTNCQMKSTFFS